MKQQIKEKIMYDIVYHKFMSTGKLEDKSVEIILENSWVFSLIHRGSTSYYLGKFFSRSIYNPTRDIVLFEQLINSFEEGYGRDKGAILIALIGDSEILFIFNNENMLDFAELLFSRLKNNRDIRALFSILLRSVYYVDNAPCIKFIFNKLPELESVDEEVIYILEMLSDRKGMRLDFAKGTISYLRQNYPDAYREFKRKQKERLVE
jgi:hypothetical protein